MLNRTKKFKYCININSPKLFKICLNINFLFVSISVLIIIYIYNLALNLSKYVFKHVLEIIVYCLIFVNYTTSICICCVSLNYYNQNILRRVLF